MKDAHDGVGQHGEGEQADHATIERVFQVDKQANEKETEVGRQHCQDQARQEFHKFIVIGADLAGNHDVVSCDDDKDGHSRIDHTDGPCRKLHDSGILVGPCCRRLCDEVERTLVDGVDQRLQDIENVLGNPLCCLTQPAVDIKRCAEGWHHRCLRHTFSSTRHHSYLMCLLGGRGRGDCHMWHCCMRRHPCCSDA